MPCVTIKRPGIFALLLASGWTAAAARAEEPSDLAQKPQERSAFARRLFEITDIILDHHLDPPTRQEMILCGAKSALASAGESPPAELGRRVSEIRTADELAAWLEDVWPEAAATPESIAKWQKAFVDGLMKPVTGHVDFLSAEDARVSSQIRGNRYIGIGVSLMMDSAVRLPRIHEVHAGGPADAAGLKAGDLIEQVEDTPLTRKDRIEDVIAITRGDEGTTFTMRVRSKDAKESRTVSLTRLPVLIPSISGVKGSPVADESMGIDPELPIGYLRLGRISGSTVHELRTWETRLRAAGAKAIILDLRCGGDDPHLAALLADSLLAEATIGKLYTREGVRKFQSDPDALFNEWPMAVLIDGRTSAGAEWVAAALQDAKRALIVGKPSRGDLLTTSQIALPESDGFLLLTTGRLERARGDDKDQARLQLLDRETPHPRRRPAAGAVRQPESRAAASVVPDIEAVFFIRTDTQVQLEPTVGTMDAPQTAAAELQKQLQSAEEAPQ